MPRLAKELSAVEVRRLSRPGLHAAGGVAGLLLRVSDTGAKYWILRTTIGGRRRDVGIGPYPEVSLASAREQAAEMRRQARQGIDPVADRQAARDALRASQAKALDFDEAARRYIASKEKEFRNEKHARQWRSSLDTYASPIIGRLPVDRIELGHIVQILEPLWHEKTETASRLRGRIEKVLDFAAVSGFRSKHNPAAWKNNLDAILPKPNKLKKVKHFPALDWREAPAFLADLRQRQGTAARALEFILLTACRSGEVRGATWGELDLDAKLWVIPGQRMKAGEEHVVPLQDDSVVLLNALPRLEGSPYVFAAPRGGQLSDMSISAVMRRMNTSAVPHGLRSTFRDWVAECTSYPHEVAEKALAHKIQNAVERAYRRGDLLEKRRRLMDDWCRFLNEGMPSGDVVGIGEARG